MNCSGSKRSLDVRIKTRWAVEKINETFPAQSGEPNIEPVMINNDGPVQ